MCRIVNHDFRHPIASHGLWFCAILTHALVIYCLFYVTFSTVQHQCMSKNRRTFRTPDRNILKQTKLANFHFRVTPGFMQSNAEQYLYVVFKCSEQDGRWYSPQNLMSVEKEILFRTDQSFFRVIFYIPEMKKIWSSQVRGERYRRPILRELASQGIWDFPAEWAMQLSAGIRRCLRQTRAGTWELIAKHVRQNHSH
jgi:hypothetical protein